MAMYLHPVTRVPLNSLTERNPRLDTDALQRTARLLREEGKSMNDIAGHLGTHSREVCRVLRGQLRRRYPKLRGTARRATRADPRQIPLL